MTKILIALMAMAPQRKDEERGATAVEYGLMVALIAVVIIAAVLALGNELSSLFLEVKDKLAGTGTAT